MKIIYKLIFAFLFFVFANKVIAQVLLLPLNSNPTIQKYLNENNNSKSIKAANDTLDLPFFDDFSKKSVYPDILNWLDNQVFVNQSFGDNPPSIGVATFDALNNAGELHSNAGTTTFLSDSLTSKPINLYNSYLKNPLSISTSELYYFNQYNSLYYPSDSLIYIVNLTYYNCNTSPTNYNVDMIIYYDSVGYVRNVSNELYTYDSVSGTYTLIEKNIFHQYTPADSIYLSFYYQPQGLGGVAPVPTDSLVLEFKAPSKNWSKIWAMPGKSNQPFQQVLIPITDTSYYKKGFQFRFKNYSELFISPNPAYASNVGFWNIDYLKIDVNRSVTDTTSDDITFVNPLDTILKNYKTVPWSHYKFVGNYQYGKLKFLFRNLSDTVKLGTKSIKITNLTENQLIINNSLGSENISAFSDSTFNITDNSVYFPATTSNKAEFEIKLSLTNSVLNSNEYLRWNDTLNYYQNFDNYYAYDDGTPERGIGLSGENSQTGKFAVKYYTLMPDTLRGVYMFFNRTLNDANKKNFYLTIWNCVNGKPGSVLYSQMGELPQFHGLNEFQYYNLDTSVFIADTFFVGFIQTTQDLLNVGFDLNNNNASKTFYNINGYWLNIPYSGTTMIRPVFSSEPFNYVVTNNIKSINIYPNPATDFVYIDETKNCNVEIIDLAGVLVLNTKINSNKINVSTLSNGIYILKVTNNKSVFTTKLIINR